MIRRLLPALAVATLVLAGAACGGDDGGDEPTRSTTTTPDTASTPDATEPAASTTEGAAGDDECTWLALDDAGAAVGQAMTLTAAGPGGCFFDAQGGTGPSIQVSSIEIAIDVDEYVEGSKAVCEGEIVDVANGDTAWACRSSFAPQGIAVFGETMVVADLQDAASEAEGLDLAAKVAAVLTAG